MNETTKSRRHNYILAYILIAVAVVLPIFNIGFLHPHYQQLVIDHATDEALRFGEYLSHHYIQADLEKSTISASTRSMVDHFIKDIHLDKIKIFDQKGTIIFSTLKSEEGALNTKDYFHNQVMKGQTYTKYVKKDRQTLEDVYSKHTVIEAYTPIMNQDRFLGAVETYYDITEVIEEINVIKVKIEYSMILISFILIVFALYSIRRLNKLEIQKGEALKQIFQSSKLASVGELAAGAAHEINNPLTVLNHFGQKLKTISHQCPEVAKLIDAHERSTNKIKNIVISLNSYAKTTPGNFQELHINDTLQEIVSLQKSIYEAQGINLKLDLLAKEDIVLVDPSKIKQSILNLLSNAKDALVTATDKTINIGTQNSNKTIQISISDSGIGIPKQDLERIYDPFFTTKRPDKGVGLGLSIVHTAISESKGTINVNSTLGKGTTFIISLPIK